jgi:hypothetical protein
LPRPDEREAVDAEGLERLLLGDGRERDAVERVDHGDELVLGAGAAEGDEGVVQGRHALLAERAGLPELRVLVFDGDAGGVADEAVAAVEVRPGDVDGRWVGLPVERFELLAQRPGLGGGGVDDRAGRGGRLGAVDRSRGTKPDCEPRPPIVKYIAPSGPISMSVTGSGLPTTNGSNVPA